MRWLGELGGRDVCMHTMCTHAHMGKEVCEKLLIRYRRH